MKNILFTICGRAGSKGIKNKNIRNFCGVPLPYYTLSAIDLFIKRHPEFSYRIVLNTDSKALIDIVNSNKMLSVKVIKRIPELAGDYVGKIEVIKDCLERMEVECNIRFDAVVDCDITSPLRTVDDIENLLTVHFSKNPDVTTSVTNARRNPFFNQVMKTDKGVRKVISSNFTARQQAPEIFDMNASLYAYSPDFLHSGKGVLDGYCEIVEMYDTAVLDLDHENDFELMEVIARYLFENKKRFKIIRDNIHLTVPRLSS